MPISQRGRCCLLLLCVASGAALPGLGCGNPSAASPAASAATQHGSNTPVTMPAHASTGAPQPVAGQTRDRSAEDADVAAIEKLDGRIYREGPDRVVVKVDLARGNITDADLVHVRLFSALQELDLHAPLISDAGLEHLQGLTNLRVLILNFTSISGPGLVHLRGLTHLQELDLGSSHLQDGGLEYLRSLTQLQTLNLKLTGVTDAGLEHLRALPNLQRLDVRLTHVSDPGVKRLQQALPRLKIEF
jgi:Leucine Rich repeat